MPRETFTINGSVLARDSRTGIVGLQVEAWDKDRILDDLVGSARTTTDGRFRIAFTHRYFRELFLDRRPDLYFKVFRHDTLIKSTEDSVLWNVTAGETEVVIDVDLPAGDKRQVLVVRGTVRDSDGDLLAGITIRAFDRDLRSEELLAEATTDKQGLYEIQYSGGQFRKAEKGAADLVVRAMAAEGSLLAASPILFNAPPIADVDLVVPAEALRPSSLFERIGRALAPLLENVKVAELEEDTEHQDLTFLSGETGFERPVLARFVLAHSLERQGLPAEFWFALLGGAFYQFDENQSLHQQLATILDALPSLDATAVSKALARGLSQREISVSFSDRFDGWVEEFLNFVASRTVSESPQPTFVKLALEAAQITDGKKQAAFARLFNQYQALTPELLDALAQGGAFTKDEIADVQTSFELNDLTRADFSVVNMIRDEFGVRRPEQIRGLARKSESEWVTWVEARQAAGEIKLPIEPGALPGQRAMSGADVYGKMLERQFREAFPTTAFAGGLERALQNGGARGLRQPQVLSSFLDRHQDFELLHTPVDDFLKSVSPTESRELAGNDAFRLELKAVQRVFKLAPTFGATDALLASGLHSAQQIYRLGQNEFVRQFAGQSGLTAETARLAWNRAADTHAAVITIVSDLKALDAESLPAALGDNSAALATFPNWNNLFQTGDLCECEQCRSVLGPAAYFADLLMFLKDRQAANPAQTVKDVLFSRRPDLGYLELNCANALTPLPYIDVVCEVLEDVVAAGENDRALPGFAAVPPDPVAAHAAVAAALAAQGIDPGEFSLTQVLSSDPDRWVAHGDDATYLLKKKPPAPDFFAEVLRNTKSSADELRAYPQYVNPIAYEKLRGARYPLSLPFDLFAEEVRGTFQKSHLDRWGLMLTLRGAAAPGNPTDGDIAAEYFGISADPAAPFDEKRLILVADPTLAGQQAVWGETGADWLGKVGQVSTFLRKTSLEYNDLLALLDLKFVNPAGDIVVQHLDPSCDTDQKMIRVLDPVKLDRIHRFLRLWRKLNGWKMWELDLVIRHPRIGAIVDPNGALDEPLLVNLFYFSRLKKRLGGKTSVEQVCALFGNLNTETRFTTLHEKREDPLYQSLFLNRRLINPLDPAFQLDPGTGDLPAGETIAAHHPVLLAVLGIREADLELFTELTKASDNTPYITDDLTLANVSFLWRQAWFSKQLRYKAEEWTTLLKIVHQDFLDFIGPEAAWTLVETIDVLKLTGFAPDELDWLLAADRSAKAATKEADAARFLAALRKEMQGIQTEFDPGQFDFLTAAPPTDIERLSALLTSLLQQLNRDEAATRFFIDTLRDEISQEQTVAGLPAGFTFPATITGAPNNIPIRNDSALRFAGMMTAAQRTTLLTDPSLAAVTGNAAYQQAIDEFFSRPRLALKFFDPVFTAPLANLPPAVDFKTLPDPALALRILYDDEQLLLRVTGILSNVEKLALEALSADADYRNAVESLATQPTLIAPPDERIWLLDADLQFPLRDLNTPANDHLAANLVAAATKGLAYLSKTLSEGAVVRASSAALGLTEALANRLLSKSVPLPGTLLAHLTVAFAATAGVVDYATLKTTFDGWFWANRAAAILKKWKITVSEWEQIAAITVGAQLLDLQTLPLDGAGAIASLDRFLRTGRLLRLRDSLPETEITLLDVLQKLDAGAYPGPGDFAADVSQLNDAWLTVDVQALIAALDLTYPADYLLAENWERLRRAFYYIDSLNAGAGTVKTFAAAAMTPVHAKTLKELLRSKFGAETWVALSAEIQDAVRERKRDALAAYLLTLPQPADAPSGKWENTNDLYAYYLLDVEMCSCQLTSRLVQGSGSIQLFVQRCLMGLEPAVEVKPDGDDGDSAWRWWKWMSKYRVWEANRKVFLWPENWIEPELKKDRSSFFKDLENELLQNDVNQYTVETAFASYLDKLDGVAQLEIAGFFQEDDAENTIIHVFGRTKGAEPHLYYYRRYDYRQWTPWEKVDLDIQGDYLVPAVVNKRLFLFWPVFTEVPDEATNSTVSTPDIHQSGVPVQKTAKRLRLQLAVSDYRQGQWTPKKISREFYQSGWITMVDAVRKFYQFLPIDRSDIDGRFGIKFAGYSLGSDGFEQAELHGAFEIADCKGVPALAAIPGNYKPVIQPEWASVGQYDNKSYSDYMKWMELGSPDEFGHLVGRHDSPQDDFTLENAFAPASNGLHYTPVLMQTPWFFEISPPWHLSYLDKLLLDGLLALVSQSAVGRDKGVEFPVPVGAWLPFFYNDKKRTFFVLPTLVRSIGERIDASDDSNRQYYPDIKKLFRQADEHFAAQVQSWLDTLDLSTFTPAQRQQLDQFLWQAFPEEAPPPVASGSPPPYTPAEIQQVKQFVKRYLMRFFHAYLGALSLQLFQGRRFHFKNFYHPFVCDFSRLVRDPLQGVPALMSRETQLQDANFNFRQRYQPTAWVVDPATEQFYPREVVDFSPAGAYASYNWELFFHVPLLIANSLSRNQRFEEARDWYHFIFNPIGVESPMPGGSPMSRYWITKPFFETTDPQYVAQRIENILRMLAGDASAPGFSAQAKQDLEDQVLDWRINPFEPHRIANYRTVAYQKTVVMKYLDNLIAWGDYLFRQDSMESINEATQLYVMAAEILGPRPQRIPPQAQPPLESFNELETAFDDFSNALVEVENLVPPLPGNGPAGSDPAPLPMLYFCIPQNEKLLGYWDTVADRLYKIRHCMNIEGVVRQLALFEPPIDPAALVKAVAAGVDLSSALADLNAPLPLYRFVVLLQKANEVCNDVKALGGALLGALEKNDVEGLSLLRQGQEIRLLEAMRVVKGHQVAEAKENLEGSKKARELAQIRKTYYESRPFMNAGEIASMSLSAASTVVSVASQFVYGLSAATRVALPQITLGGAGFGGSPYATLTTGGETVADAQGDGAKILSVIAAVLEKSAAIAGTLSSYQRRQDEWDFQRDLAATEIEQLDKSIAAAEFRVAIAEKELANHDLQIENSKAVDTFMRSKYTSQELCQWQIGQISGVFFQSYKLAYDLAKRAERSYRFELGVQDSSYISFGYWDSLKKGLLSGERLQYDLRRLESAYLEQNRREFELAKHVSIAALDPLALMKLRETGRCFIDLPEDIFDLDYPGHYFRRIKSVSLSLPCVTGPFTTISCTLRLLKNSVRINTASGDNGYPRNTDEQGLPADDDRFLENNIPVNAIAGSHAQNDSGVFELNFRDERYLPFEGAGAVSTWSLELFSDLPTNNPDPGQPDFGKLLRQFDYGTITDAILHVKYTAREDAGAFKNAAIANLRNDFSQDGATTSLRMFNLRQEFPSQWQRFLHPTDPAADNVFELEMSPSLFRILDEQKTLKINTIWLLARCVDSANYDVVLTPPLPAPPPALANRMTLIRLDEYGGLHFSQKDVATMPIEVVPDQAPVKWKMTMARPGGGTLQNAEVQDVFLVVGYQWEGA